MASHTTRVRLSGSPYRDVPKLGYQTFMDAHISARRIFLQEDYKVHAYKCHHCRFYHLGRDSQPKNDKRYSLPESARGLYVGRQRLYRLLRNYQQQK